MKTFVQLFLMVLILSCSSEEKKERPSVLESSWDEIVEVSKGTSVTMMMWQGDPYINRYMSEYVVPYLQKEYEIDLKIVSGQGTQIVSTLMAEKDAGVSQSQLDLMWINGETFYQLRQLDALFGPYVDKLPNHQLVDWSNPFISVDFQQKVDGYECPWGNVQLSFIYNANVVPTPPNTLEELEIWVKNNPGKFTISNDFTGMTLLKSWLIYFAGGEGSLSGEFDEEKYIQYSAKLWEFVNRIKPGFWNGGSTFPANVAQMHQLFANGEILFTMSNNDSEVDNKIAQGLFPVTSRAYVPTSGTIQNSHYLGIVKESGSHASAMVVINFLISPDAQWKKMQPAVWGDGTILDISSLPELWQARFDSIPGRKFAPSRQEINQYAYQEPAPEYMIRIFEDFRKQVIEAP